MANYLRSQFLKLNIKVEVVVIKHPVDKENIIMFDYDKYIQNSNKKIIQIGQQLRKVTSIYRINTGHEKLWLTGTKNFLRCKNLYTQEIKYLNLTPNTLSQNVLMKYCDEGEYDELLSKNIVFVDLFDASANNTVLECIIRNTPLIINKLPAVIEYLGEDYPLYFKDLEEVEQIINNKDLILSGHKYLANINKEELSMDYFIKKLISVLNEKKN
jgi:hypothetical protein